MNQIRRHSSINFIINFLNYVWIAFFLVFSLLYVAECWFLRLSVFLNKRQIESACQR